MTAALGEHGLCVFALEERLFALDVDLVVEVVTVESLLPLPKAPSFVLGLFSLRGTPIPVVDVCRVLGFGSMRVKASPIVLVLKSGDLMAAFPVDRMEEVAHPSRGTITERDADEHPAVACFFSADNVRPPRVITVLDPQYLLERLRGTK